MKKAMQNKMALLESKFPKAWFKDGGEFSSGYENAIWTGEGSEMYDEEYEFDVPLFNYYGYQDTLGINPKFNAILDSLDLWAEFYDGGTVFIFER